MIDRIKQIIEDKGMQFSTFADTIQVSHSTISHILNGRNGPSKITIDKILKAFPDISSSWFLRGEGTMYKRDQIFMQTDLFDEKRPVELIEKSQVCEYSQKNEINTPDNRVDLPIIQDINLSNSTSKKIDKLMILFSDKTFMTFIPE